MTSELQFLQAAITELDSALGKSDEEARNELFRDAVVFRYWRGLDLTLEALRSVLRDRFADEAGALTVGELLRLARHRGLVPDADQWLAYFAARFDPAILLDRQGAFEQARSFADRSKRLIRALRDAESRDEKARGALTEPWDSSRITHG